jgi:hypothetical protein
MKLFPLLVLGTLVGQATAATVDVPAAVDTFVTTAGLDSSYSNLPYLIVGRGGGSAPARSRSLLGFGELNNVLPPTAQVESAVLRLYQSVTAAADKEIEVYRITEFWSGPTTTWNQIPSVLASPIARATPGPGGGWKEIDVRETVKGWLTGAYPNFGLGLKSDEASASERRFDSMEAPGNHPHLHIRYRTSSTPPSGNRSLERVDLLSEPGGAQKIRVVWHGQVTGFDAEPGRSIDLSCEIQVKVNGAVNRLIWQRLHAQLRTGSGSGGGALSCDDSYPICGGDCPLDFSFDTGEGTGRCQRHDDPTADQ